MENSHIQWTTHTFNPWWGCMKVSDGCKNCYAEALSQRFNPGHWGPNSTRKEMSEPYWAKPIAWNKSAQRAGVKAKVFCASMADVFEGLNETFPSLQRLFHIIETTPHLIWQLLTKRPENIMKLVPAHWQQKFPDNVWIGTSVENQVTAYRRIPYLLSIPAKVRFLSCEPLMGSVDLSPWIGPVEIDTLTTECGYFERSEINGGYGCNHPDQEEKENGCGKCYDFSCPIASRLEPSEPLDQPIYKAFGLSGTEYNFLMKHDNPIDWVIVGGESGPAARPMHPDWVRQLRDQCKSAEVPFFFKQWGQWKCIYDRDVEDPDWRNIPPKKDNRRVVNLEGGHGFHGERVVFMDKLKGKNTDNTIDGKTHLNFPKI
jgi:protein gp37